MMNVETAAEDVLNDLRAIKHGEDLDQLRLLAKVYLDAQGYVSDLEKAQLGFAWDQAEAGLKAFNDGLRMMIRIYRKE